MTVPANDRRVLTHGPAIRPERCVPRIMGILDVSLTPGFTTRVRLEAFGDGASDELWLTMDWPAAKALRDRLDACLPPGERYGTQRGSI